VILDEGRTERRSVLLKGRESFDDDEVEGLTAREVEATVEAFLTASTAAAPTAEALLTPEG